jgi:hypothetical protein
VDSITELLFDNLFLLQLAATFIVGGAWITFATVVADRLGSKLGGIIAGLPSTILVPLLFIGIIQSPQAASDATTLMPVISGINTLFLAIYAASSSKSFTKGLLTAFGVFFVLAIAVVISGAFTFELSVAAYLALAVVSYFLIQSVKDLPSPISGTGRRHSKGEIGARFFASGLVISAAVLVSKLAGPVLGGVISDLPIGNSSTVVISYKSRGLEFSRSIVKPLMFSGIASVFAYIVVVRYAYPALGLLWGTLVACLASVAGAALVYLMSEKSK